MTARQHCSDSQVSLVEPRMVSGDRPESRITSMSTVGSACKASSTSFVTNSLATPAV